MPKHDVEGQAGAERYTAAFGGADAYDDKYRVPNFFRYNERVYRPFVRAVVKKAGLLPGQFVLDAGCGQGFFSSLLAENGLQVLGLDRSAEGVAAARAGYRGNSVNFIRGDVLDLTYEQSFDGIFVRSCSLYNDQDFQDRQKVTAKFLKYLRPGGVLIFDYYTRLNKRVVSPGWRYHDLSATRVHFAVFERAQIYFSLRAECSVLGAHAFSRWSSRFAELVSTYRTLGGEIVVFLRRGRSTSPWKAQRVMKPERRPWMAGAGAGPIRRRWPRSDGLTSLMPGLVGILSAAPSEQCRALVRAMLSALSRREADPCGEASLPETHLYVGWTAHPDSFAAKMSRAAAAPHLQLAFAGECSAKDVATELPLLELYQQYGASFVGMLNGLFSGVILDARTGEALLFNDRYGFERIYVREHGEGFVFASEATALLAIDAEARELDADGIAELLTFGGISSGRTPFRGVRLLPSGSLWTIGRAGTVRKSLYFDPVAAAPRRALPAAALDEEFGATFRRILPRYVAGPRPIGISLTGGLDTRMIMACLPAEVRPVCYTYAGPSGETMDARLGRQVASLCGLDHHVLRLDRGFFDDFGSHLDRAVRDSGGHAGATLAHEGCLSDQAAALAPVRLTGNYGGEVFRGVSTYKPVALAPSLFAGDFLPVLQAARERPRGEPLGARWGAFYEAPLHLHGVRAVARSVLTFRTPFLDNDLVDFALAASQDPLAATCTALRVVHEGRPDLAALPTDRGLRWPGHGVAHAARRLAAEVSFKLDYLEAEGSRPALAPLIQTMSKAMTASGLHAPHRFLAYGDWFRGELSTYVSDQLTSRRACEHPYLDRQGVAEVLSDHLSGRRNRLPELNAVLSLVSIERTLLKPPDQQALHFSDR